jgi:hypothetical protein
MSNDPLDGVMPPELYRQSGERLTSYEHFLAYLRLGRKRGYGRLAKALDMDVRGIERLAVRYHWRTRARVYDDLIANAALRDLLRDALAA